MYKIALYHVNGYTMNYVSICIRRFQKAFNFWGSIIYMYVYFIGVLTDLIIIRLVKDIKAIEIKV